jgi:hypothetical protein
MLAVIDKYPMMRKESQELIKQFFKVDGDSKRRQENKELIFKM